MPLRRTILVLASLAALLVVADQLFGFISLADRKGVIETRLSEAIGLPVRIHGELGLDVLPQLEVEAHDVVVENPPDRPSPELLRIGRVELGLNPWQLLRRRVEIRWLRIADAQVHLEPDADGSVSLPFEFEEMSEDEPSGDAAIRIRSIELENVDVFFRRSEGDHVTSVHVDRLKLDADDLDDRIDLGLRARYDGGEVDLGGQLGTLRELQTTTRPWPVFLEGRLLESDIEIDGAIESPGTLQGLDLAFSLLIPDFGARLRDEGYTVPRIGAVRAEGRLTRADGVLGLARLSAVTVEREPVHASVQGVIADLQQFSGVALDLELESNLNLLQPFVDRELPAGITLVAQAKIDDRDGTLGIEGTARATDPAERVVLTLDGGHDDLSRIAEIEVGIELRATDLAALAEVAELDLTLPDIGPLEAHGKLRDRDGAFSLRGVVVKLGQLEDLWLQLEGDIHDLGKLGGVLMTARFGDPDTADTPARLGVDLSGFGSMVGEAIVSDEDGTLGIERFEVRAGRADAVQLIVTGSFEDLRSTDEIVVHAELNARDLQQLGKMIGADLPPIGPVSFVGQVTGSDEELRSTGEVRLDQTVLSGEWLASFAPATQPHVRARLRSPHVRLRDLGLYDRPEGAPQVASPAQARERPVAVDDGFDPEALRRVDLDLSLKVDRITGLDERELENVTLSIKLDSGRLEADGYAVGGTEELPTRIEAHFVLDGRGQTPDHALAVEASGVDIGEWMRQLQVEGQHSGLADALLDLRTRGRTTEEMRNNLDGYAGLTLRGASLVSKTARRFVISVATVAFPTLRARDVEEGRVSCFRAEFDVKRGVATARTLVLQGPSESVAGRGRIDLGGDAYDLTLTPHSRNPALIGAAATVRVTGPLADPRFSAVPRSLVTSAARGLFANAMRPARAVLSPVLSNDNTREDACAAPLVRNGE